MSHITNLRIAVLNFLFIAEINTRTKDVRWQELILGPALPCPALPICSWVVPTVGPHTSIINQENTSTDLPTGKSNGTIFSIESPSFQMNIACVELKTKQQQQKTNQHN